MVFKNLRNIREDHDIKQREIAELLHVSQNTYSQEQMTQHSRSNKIAPFYYLETYANRKQQSPTGWRLLLLKNLIIIC